MQFEIAYRPGQSMARAVLAPGEQLVAESGAMVGMSTNVHMETSAGGMKAGLKRLFGGESFFRNTFTAQGGPGEVLLGQVLCGDMIALDMNAEGYFVQSASYIASSAGVNIDTKVGGFRSFFAGEGVFVLKATASAPGPAAGGCLRRHPRAALRRQHRHRHGPPGRVGRRPAIQGGQERRRLARQLPVGRGPGVSLQRPGPHLDSNPQPRGIRARRGGHAAPAGGLSMQYQLVDKPDFAVIQVRFDQPGEQLIAESGAMVARDAGIEMKSSIQGGLGGALKRKMLGGESLFQNTFTATQAGQSIWLAPAPEGDIVNLDMNGQHELMLNSGAYLASAPTVNLDTKWGGAKGFFSGTGFFLLKCSGHGPLFFNAFGGIHAVDVGPAGTSWTPTTWWASPPASTTRSPRWAASRACSSAARVWSAASRGRAACGSPRAPRAGSRRSCTPSGG
jgi:uncharacterized protein (TIGR00266 family)